MAQLKTLLSIMALFLCVQSVVADLNPSDINTAPVDCSRSREIIDECGLQMSFSFTYPQYGFPQNHTSLLDTCKRQSEAIKCVRNYSKCLSPLSRQVTLQMVSSRTRYNKKLCTPQPSETSKRFIELNQCMVKSNLGQTKGVRAELNAILVPEAINKAFQSHSDVLLKHSCCSISHQKQEYLDTSKPQCSKYGPSLTELVESFLKEPVGDICPELDPVKLGCDKLQKLKLDKRHQSRFFILPILDVAQKLAA